MVTVHSTDTIDAMEAMDGMKAMGNIGAMDTMAGATPSIRKLLRPKHLGRPRFFWRRSLGVLKCLGGVLGCFGGEFGRRGQTNMALWQQGIRPLWVIIEHLAYMVGRCHGILESRLHGAQVPSAHVFSDPNRKPRSNASDLVFLC